jgi:hypothetical protein
VKNAYKVRRKTKYIVEKGIERQRVCRAADEIKIDG